MATAYHQTCPKNKATVNDMDLINKCTGLWIRDYCQKVLPICMARDRRYQLL